MEGSDIVTSVYIKAHTSSSVQTGSIFPSNSSGVLCDHTDVTHIFGFGAHKRLLAFDKWSGKSFKINLIVE